MVKFWKGFFGGLIAALTFSALALIGGGVIVHNHSSNSSGGTTISTLNVSASNSITDQRPCAANFERTRWGFCAATMNFGNTALVRDVCTSIALPDPNAKAVMLELNANANSGNAVSVRQSLIQKHGDSGCGANKQNTMVNAVGREFVATAAGNTVVSVSTVGTVTVHPGENNFYLLFQDDAANQGTASYQIVGYYD